MKNVEGITTTRWLREAGLGRDAVASRVERGELIRLGRGIYRVGGVEDSARARHVAALTAVGRPVALTGLSALWVRGHLDVPPRRPDLLVPFPRHVKQHLGARVRSTVRFDLADVRRRGDLPVVSAAWAVCDHARDVTVYDLARLIAAGVGAEWTSLERLADCADVRGRTPGAPRMRRALELLRPGVAFSSTEARLARALRRAGLAVELNVPIRRSDGSVVARADLVVEGLLLDVEVDGPHHWLPEGAAADRRRDRELSALGWTVLRYSVVEIDGRLEAVVHDVLRRVERLRIQPA